ncbi:MAG: TIGR00730 family Rossman fold protein [Maricaulaceae bacterium]
MALAEATGSAIAGAGHRLVYGGGGSGLMGATARSAHKAGGDVLGIIPEFLKELEKLLKDVPHDIVPDMHTRKKKMYDASDAFIVLPGGIGTLEEAVEIISWMRLQLHKKPVVFLSNDGYWAPLLALFNHTIGNGFTPEWMNEGIFEAETPEAALELVETAWENPTPTRPIGEIPADKI